MTNLLERVWEYSLKNPVGFTLNIETFIKVEIGYAVAFKETQNSFGIEDLEKVINHALENDKTIGGWLDGESGLFYFDSVKIFNDTELEQAIEFAKQNEQIAIFDLLLNEEIRFEEGF